MLWPPSMQVRPARHGSWSVHNTHLYTYVRYMYTRRLLFANRFKSFAGQEIKHSIVLKNNGKQFMPKGLLGGGGGVYCKKIHSFDKTKTNTNEFGLRLTYCLGISKGLWTVINYLGIWCLKNETKQTSDVLKNLTLSSRRFRYSWSTYEWLFTASYYII